MLKSDLHTHTIFSHGSDTVAAMVAAARNLGLLYYGISEHSPRPAGYTYAQDYQEHLLELFPKYIRLLKLFRGESDKYFRVLMGLELDYMPDETEFAKKSALAYDYDYIIGGLHFQGHWGFDGPAQEWESINPEKYPDIYEQYYRDMRHMSESGLVQIIAHPDLIKLHSIEHFRKWIVTPKAQELVKETLASIASRDQVLEVSSAGLRKPCNEIYPGPEIMQMAADLNMKICLSSDAHSQGQICYAFKELEEYVKKYGFNKTHIVVERKPQPLDLD